MILFTPLPPRCAAACVFATPGDDPDDITTARCWHPETTRGKGPVPVVEARAIGAFCGPEAHRMEFKK